MCGIVGIADRHPIFDRGILERMRDAMRHRGPDDAGVLWSKDGQVGLAHRRLAIIDLSPSGHQPMRSRSGGLAVVFNGEIYNYKDLRKELEERGHSFASQSDTEVLLEAYLEWGVDFLTRLNGAFAFCIHDSTNRRLVLARDRAGEKPLFYMHSERRFAFASELKALMADSSMPRNLNFQALEFYLSYGHIPQDFCILESVLKLPPAHFLILDLSTNTFQVKCYWKIPPQQPDDGTSLDELVVEAETLLLDSVARQLVADVPVGVLLSGGVDSSILTALAARVTSAPVNTFTVSFPGQGTYDEGPWAQIVSKYFGTKHIELPAEPATVDLLPSLARQFDEPMCDSSMLPTFLLARLVRQHCSVALGGDGGDELFGGYWNYQWLMRQAQVRRWIPGGIRSILGATALRLPVGTYGRNYLLGMGGALSNAIAHSGLFFDSRARGRLLLPQALQGRLNLIQPERYKAGLCEPERGVPGEGMAVDFRMYLADDILVKVDRASMLNSLEVRTPFLDHRVIEFAFSRVPNRFRATLSARKILLRKLGERLLPPQLDLSRKQGFSLPLKSWFKGEWGRMAEDVLENADPDLFDRSFVRRLIASQRRGLTRNTERIFSLTLFELWRREYRVSLGAAVVA